MGITVDVRVWDLRKRTRTGRATRFEVHWQQRAGTAYDDETPS